MTASSSDRDEAFRRSLLSEETQKSIQRNKSKRVQRALTFSSHVSPLEEPSKPIPSAPVLLSTSLQALRLHILLETDPLRVERHSFRLQVQSLSTFGASVALMGFMLSSMVVILPHTITLVGWVQVAIMLFISFACTKTTSHLVQSIQFCKETLDNTLCTWDDVINLALNRFGKMAWCIFSILQLVATGITFLIIAGNHTSYAYHNTTSTSYNPSEKMPSSHFTISHSVIISICLGLILCFTSSMSLSLRSRLHTLGVCLGVIVSVCVFAGPFFLVWCEKHWGCEGSHFDRHGRECAGHDVVATPKNLPFGMMVAMFCLGAHTPVAQTITRSMEQQESFPLSHSLASGISLFLILTCAISGAYFFGNCTHDEITVNLFDVNFNNTLNIGRVLCGVVAVSALCTANTFIVPFASFLCSAFGATNLITKSLVTLFAIVLEVSVAWAANGDVLTAATMAGAMTTLVSVLFPNVVFTVLRWSGLSVWRRVYLVLIMALSLTSMISGVVTSALRQANVDF
eukprot:c10286_g1_i1.p1 GENE.c10286_g1_i1~~c10286_g1_i1.p1  ORF type:complete len:530 (-),score=113.60 c10286_g1_i1:547-2091(-)